MWLYTTIGFFSVVAKDGGMTVRSRHRADLERLKAIRLTSAGCRSELESTPILSTPNNDYPYRMVLTSTTFESLFVKLLRDITYRNFKAAAGTLLGEAREKTLHDLWRVTRKGAGK